MILLYDVTEQSFDNNGLGPLSDATSCTVTEERNGAYELKMVYPSSGPLFSELTDDRIIFCKPNPYDDPEPFRIYRRTDPRNGLATIYANHISYDLSNIPLSPFTATSALDAMSKMQENQAIESPFTFWTDKTTSAEMAVSVPCSARSQLGGKTGSILDVYGGEYQFSRFLVRLYNERGANRGVSIRYGKNLTDIEQDRNIADAYTGVYPYWADGDGNLIELPEKVIYASGTFPMQKVRPLDLSQDFEEEPSVDELRAAAQSYMQSNNIGVPTVSITVDFIALDQTEEYKDMPLLESVRLCDTVNVEFPKLGISAKAKCIKTEYDALKDRYSSIQLGEAKSSISDTVSDQQKEIQEKPNTTMMQQAISQLTAAILGAQGGSVRLLDTNGDGEPDTLYIADNPDPAQAVKVWRFNYEGWGASENGYNGPFRLGASFDSGIIADFITAGTLNANLVHIINLIVDHLQSTDGTYTLDSSSAKMKFTAGKNLRVNIDVDNIEDGSGDIFNSGNIKAYSGNVSSSGTLQDNNAHVSGMYGYYGEFGRKRDGSYDGYVETNEVRIQTIRPNHGRAGIYQASNPRWLRIGINGGDYILYGEPYDDG